MSWQRALTIALAAAIPVLHAAASDASDAIERIRGVAAEGRGNAAAAAAVRVLGGLPASELPVLLRAMDDANDYALNWLRAAADTVAQRAAASGQAVPVATLREFVLDVRHHPRARRYAYELVRTADPAAGREMLPGFRDDPSVELRREAVQGLVDASAKAGKDEAVPKLREALGAARDVDQIDAIAKRLGELGSVVDLRAKFGWVSEWRAVAPFDNVGGVGFAREYPPESAFDPAAEYEGKTGKVGWKTLVTTNDYGVVDFNKPFTALKGAVGYAAAEFNATESRPAEIRLGCINGWKVWFNGKFLFGRDEYHRNVEIDQYRMPVTLRKGRNVIVVKLCQNEQTEDWAAAWEFQLRITDALGTPIVPVR